MLCIRKNIFVNNECYEKLRRVETLEAPLRASGALMGGLVEPRERHSGLFWVVLELPVGGSGIHCGGLEGLKLIKLK